MQGGGGGESPTQKFHAQTWAYISRKILNIYSYETCIIISLQKLRLLVAFAVENEEVRWPD